MTTGKPAVKTKSRKLKVKKETLRDLEVRTKDVKGGQTLIATCVCTRTCPQSCVAACLSSGCVMK